MNDNNFSNTEKRLATDKVGSLIARYSIPNTIAFVFFSIQAIIDGIIVGNYLGADALASVSLILPAYMLPSGIAQILTIGAQAQMSIAMGEQNYVRAKTALKTGSMSILVFSLIIFSIFNVFPVQLAGIMGAEGDLLEGSLNYIHGLMPFVGVNLIMFFLNYVLKTLGHPRFAMNVIILSILLNIVLSILFVTQFDLGTFGVGLATGVSISVGCLLSLFVVFKSLRSHPALKKIRGKFSWHSLGRMFYNGSSEGLTEIAMNITVVLFNLTFLKYAGKEGIAAFAVTNYIIFIGTSILLGISDGAIPVISYNYGASLWDRVRQGFKVTLRANFIIGVMLMVILWTLGEYVLSIFLDDSSQDVIDMAVHGSRIMGFAFLLNGFNISSASFFTALDNAKWSLVISACRGLIFIVIGITILPLIFGTNGIWMTVAMAELFTAMLSFMLLRRVKHR